ncbi:hypothetical protein [Botrimarina sp.]|uniref:hypothetical protein n=1 Tax=Botrimarina sp. TaxID=2795802 RepID=UPI0032EC3AB2
MTPLPPRPAAENVARRRRVGERQREKVVQPHAPSNCAEAIRAAGEPTPREA